LIKYQLKAKDVLAKAFLNKGSNEFQVLVPKTLQEALRMAANLLDKNQELEIMNAVMEPKVKKYDSFMECGNTQTIGEVAKILGIGPNRLFAFLREKKVLMNGQKGSKNIPYQRYINEGLFAVKESLIMNGKYIFNQPQTLVLPKGVSFIAGLLEQNKISATA
jgi:phage antirepressor YoqD-like protein